MTDTGVVSEAETVSTETLATLGEGHIAYVKQIRSEDVPGLFPQAPKIAPADLAGAGLDSVEFEGRQKHLGRMPGAARGDALQEAIEPTRDGHLAPLAGPDAVAELTGPRGAVFELRAPRR